jgi:protein gp37
MDLAEALTLVEASPGARRRAHPRSVEHAGAIRFLSCEPLLGPFDIARFLPCEICRDRGWLMENPFAEFNKGMRACGRCAAQAEGRGLRLGRDQYAEKAWKAIDWVVVGGESGPRSRPFALEWARSIIAQCKAAGVPAS